MKTTLTNRIFSVAIVMLLAITAKSQTIDIGPNEYAFQFTADPDFGLFFNATESRYEFLNSTATPIFGFSAGSGQMTTNLQFSPTADLLIGNNRYAFRAASNPNFGLFFNAAETEYQFLNNAAEPVFSVNANTGRLDNDLRFNADKSLRVAPGEFGLRSAALPNAGLVFGLTGYEFRTADGNTAVYIDANTGDMGVGNTNPFSKLHVGGDLRLDGILYAENSLAMAAWDVFADANQYAINETNVGSRIQVLPGGNVGLSTDAPTSRLDVNGEARIRELPLDNALDQVVVADADGNLHTRSASTLTSGGSSIWSQNGTTAFYDAGSVAIGTNTTNNKLAVHGPNNVMSIQSVSSGAGDTPFIVRSGNGSIEGMVVRANGNVGMGTVNPGAKLDVAGSLRSSNITTGSTKINVVSSRRIEHIESCLPANGAFMYADFWGCGNEFNFIEFRRGNTGMKFRVTQGGNVYADGKIFCREAEVTLASFPDYVFKADYDLMSLSEVDAFIQENGHLPNMPTEAEVVENGLNLGEMNVKLVEKVEELTLHLIEKEKQYEALQSRLEMLEKAILNQD